MNDDPMSGLKAELENVKERREALVKALERLAVERERTAKSLSHLVRGTMVDEKPKPSALLGVGILFLLAIPLTGVVISRFWDWYVVELFSLPLISAMEATGICLLASIFLPYYKVTSENFSRLTVERILRLGVTWLIGWCIHWFL